MAAAAPIVPSQAVLAAQEFPIGSTGYKVSSDIGSPADKPDGDTPCDRASYDVEKAVAGVKSTDAKAVRGPQRLEASVISRPMAGVMRQLFATCTTQFRYSTSAAVAPLPADLSRYTGFIVRSPKQRSLIGVVDVRGAAVGAEVDASGSAPVDEDAFWQLLRAQIAKIERQP